MSYFPDGVFLKRNLRSKMGSQERLISPVANLVAAVAAGGIQHLTLEMWTQDSNPVTWTPVGVERSTGRGSEGPLDGFDNLTFAPSHWGKRVEERRGSMRDTLV
jgi:hypothetical protein